MNHSPQSANDVIKSRPKASTRGAWLVWPGFCYALLLALTISGRSLWTDEAFSAYVACHRSLHSLFTTLLAGDSSDLQTALYYVYLHGWVSVFGASEVALRAANVPFIVCFGCFFSWISARVFRARWFWIAPACLPFMWVYASQVRVYFPLLTVSTVCVGCCLAYFEQPSTRERRVLPWIILASLLLGTMFDMLMLLAVAPLLLVAAIYWVADRETIRVLDWKVPLLVFTAPFLVLFSYLAWTFGRGIGYDYAKPTLLSMASVFFRLVGFLGLGPNRRYDIPFKPYLLTIGLAAIVLLCAAAAATFAGRRKANRLPSVALLSSFVLASLEVTVLSFALRQQIDVRHLAAIVPFLLFLPLASIAGPTAGLYGRAALVSFGLFTAVWLIADLRLNLLPEYKEEDFRSAVTQAIELKQEFGGEIALVADPVAGAYYGLELTGPQPCFPLTENCATGFRLVDWTRKAAAALAVNWTPAQIQPWLDHLQIEGEHAIVIISRGRHPSVFNSPWWPILQSRQQASVYPIHGFFVYDLKPRHITGQALGLRGKS